MKEDTIAAIATAPGQGGIGIIRISGPESEKILKKIFRPAGLKETYGWKSHFLMYGRITDGAEILDECMAVIMRSPKSYTREDVAEIQSHGGTQVLQSILELVLKCGARMAEAGEFTRRAFLNGRIDLSRAEAVMSLIQARGEPLYRPAENRNGALRSARCQGALQLLSAKLLTIYTFSRPDWLPVSIILKKSVMKKVQVLCAKDWSI